MRRITKLAIVLIFCLVSGLVIAGPVNVNKANATEIAEALTGIGKSKAEAIIKDREANGPFKNADDLTRVKGIGPATISKNKELILVK